MSPKLEHQDRTTNFATHPSAYEELQIQLLQNVCIDQHITKHICVKCMLQVHVMRNSFKATNTKMFYLGVCLLHILLLFFLSSLLNIHHEYFWRYVAALYDKCDIHSSCKRIIFGCDNKIISGLPNGILIIFDSRVCVCSYCDWICYNINFKKIFLNISIIYYLYACQFLGEKVGKLVLISSFCI